MSRSDRLFDLLRLLRDGKLHRAQDIASELGVSTRTVYRDIETLVDSGVPITGTRGSGYQTRPDITLPPMTLTPEELNALTLGIAIVSEAGDPALSAPAAALSDKLDALLPQQGISDDDAWRFAKSPFADAARGLGHMPTLRSAIKARQKLALTVQGNTHTARPLSLENWGRVWSVIVWSETSATFEEFRVDQIETATALPALFEDEPGKTLADLHQR